MASLCALMGQYKSLFTVVQLAARSSWAVSVCPLPSPKEPDNRFGGENDALAATVPSGACNTMHKAGQELRPQLPVGK